MSTIALYSKIELLPEHLRQQVLDYIEFLLSREVKQKPTKPPTKLNLPIKPALDKAGSLADNPDTSEEQSDYVLLAAPKPLKAGFLKGSFAMAADFDEPPEDFKEHMQ